jgi:GTPase SAR1 family protein
MTIIEPQKNFDNLAACLRSALGMLELEPSSQLRQDIISVCDYLENPTYRIAVFGPFNYGKSTLLNALLGQRTLPIDLIPTTGAAIRVRYGDDLQTKITLKDGREIQEKGTDILKQYAILDDRRCMRDDVASVEVYCCHPFLQTGVEFLDLPGTNDREAQDELVRDKLLSADLIVQVLDARKLMTLGEREHLRDWLLDRGINTVVFVVNFINLLEREEQKEIYYRLRFVAESFRSNLPDGVSNLYRVDALPALRARLKGDTAAAQETGLSTFESALQTIVISQQKITSVQLPRVLALSDRLYRVAEEKRNSIVTQIETEKQKQQAKIELKQKAQKLIKQGFERSISDFQGWLYLPKLLSHYQAEIANALSRKTFLTWRQGEFKQTVVSYQTAIHEWVKKACDFFEQNYPGGFSISLPEPPEISIDTPPTIPKNKSGDRDIASVAIPTGIGWVLGGPVGAALLGGASYLLNKNTTDPDEQNRGEYDAELIGQIYANAAEEYLTRFSEDAVWTIREYEAKVEKVINFPISETKSENSIAHYQLQLLNNLLENLQQEIELKQ